MYLIPMNNIVDNSQYLKRLIDERGDVREPKYDDDDSDGTDSQFGNSTVSRSDRRDPASARFCHTVNTALIDGIVALEARATVLLNVDCLLGITESFGLIVADQGRLVA